MKKKSKPLLLFYLLVTYVFFQFIWWSYLLVEQNNEIYHLKKELNLLSHEDPQMVIEKGNELEKKLHNKWMMITGEGLVFMVLLVIGFLQVRNTFKKESELTSQQKNFLLSITHELKSPIASVKLQLETLLKRDLDKAKQNEIITSALHDTERLNTLVENVLLAAMIDNHSSVIYREHFDLSVFVNDTLTKAITSIKPNHQVKLDIQPSIYFDIDPMAFSSVILNLFENAIKYSPENSTITVDLIKKGTRIWLSIKDEGAGISDQEKQVVFKKFYRIGNEETRKTKGTGLGLHIAKHFVEKHHGEIIIQDNIPRGSIFHVILDDKAVVKT